MNTHQALNLYLKENCRTSHDSVDNLVMSVKPFDNKENYTKFLQLQAVFHKIVDDIYKDKNLNQKINNLAELARYEDVMKDLKDLDATEATIKHPIPSPQGSERLGWLYCAEGSNLGAAFLFKAAQKQLNFNAEKGARHLAPHLEGRAKHWQNFCNQFNRMELSAAERESALKGALEAFGFYKVLLREIFLLKPELVS